MQEPLESRENITSLISRLKFPGMITLSIINGALYFAIARQGGKNIEELFDINGETANIVISVVSGGSSLVYTMFTYKTLEFVALKPNSLTEGFLSTLAPFSASAFFTAGNLGSQILGFSDVDAITIGLALYFLRIINCVDASIKFPNRLSEMKDDWFEAWHSGDYKELARLIGIGFCSLGYATSATDAIYNAVKNVFELAGMSASYTDAISYIPSILGAIGTLPLILYWSHRGLRQLTFGGKIDENGETRDPTDRYTYIGLACVTPVTLGILGAVTNSGGAVFGRLGTFASVIRLSTSLCYAVCAGTPGMATLVRETSHKVQRLLSKESDYPNLLEHENFCDSDNRVVDLEQAEKSDNRWSFFSKNDAERDDYKSCSCTIV